MVYTTTQIIRDAVAQNRKHLAKSRINEKMWRKEQAALPPEQRTKKV